MNWTLEVVPVPVTDVDRAKEFFTEKLGFNLDYDTRGGGEFGPVQLTPPGSGCSIVIGKGMSAMEPGSLKGVQFVVADLQKARELLLERGVEVSEIRVAGPEGFRPAQDGDSLDNVGFVFFNDPDGNHWAVQQVSSRS
ncbi:glyoxalase [Salinispora arenicola]|uniref:Catechol 2,3-dioxygenase-like lactoylglutathione lyase family enzyme n=2 Tax=Salinispora arenicola TaxID=168697 RepID=A0A542XT55_SALAC|nr:VOC family protein [Salinispora arenicola]MCN0176865.1 VOC family protein [Salinispora arenicola]NIL40075.1 glyoxalase [Salinispora arenicola]NIL58080.1 glyoxalase [Salinispora arenicola]NIL62974.1 glyoxalase [Salinispora arenicola]TQL39012.1 catechol 2,3-dioxygenase-like lactoylglutathione lyase family enzyme [Salinispora arenicola]